MSKFVFLIIASLVLGCNCPPKKGSKKDVKLEELTENDGDTAPTIKTHDSLALRSEEMVRSEHATTQEQRLNVVDFGADSTGTSFSTHAIESAIKACGGGVCILYFPAGTYLIDRYIEGQSNLHIKGDGLSSLLKIVSESGGPGKLSLGILNFVDCENIILENITFDVNAGANFSKCLRIYNSREIVIRNCRFINSNREAVNRKWTIMAMECRDIENVLIENNVSVGCQFKLAGGDGSVRNIQVKSNRISECPQMGISIVAKVNDRPVSFEQILIEDNHFELIDNHTIYIGYDRGKGAPAHRLSIDGVVIRNNTILNTGYLSEHNASGLLFRFASDTRNIEITDNVIHNDKLIQFARGLDITAADGKPELLQGLVIRQNKISGMRVASIMIDHVKDAIVENNTLTGGTRSIKMYDCENIVIRNNKLSENAFGIETGRSKNIDIQHNTIENTKWAVLMESEKPDDEVSGRISGNTIKKSQVAIHSRGSGKFDITHKDNILEDVKEERRENESGKNN